MTRSSEGMIAAAWLHQMRCHGCRHCLEVCPIADSQIVSAGGLLRAMDCPGTMTEEERRFVLDCTLCGQCVPVCPTGARRDVMTHGLKFLVAPQTEKPPAGDWPHRWWEGLRRDVRHLMHEPSLGPLAPLVDRESLAAGSRSLLWAGRHASRLPDLTLSLFHFCRQLVRDLELIAGETYPSGRAWTVGDAIGAEQSAHAFLAFCRRMHPEEIICTEDEDARFFSTVLAGCSESERPRVEVWMVADWLARFRGRVVWKPEYEHVFRLPATLREETERRFPSRFAGDEHVRNYAHTGLPFTLSEGHTAVDPNSRNVSDLPRQVLRHLRSHGGRVLVVETFSAALRLKDRAAIEGGAEVLFVHEALEYAPEAPVPTFVLAEPLAVVAVEEAPEEEKSLLDADGDVVVPLEEHFWFDDDETPPTIEEDPPAGEETPPEPGEPPDEPRS